MMKLKGMTSWSSSLFIALFLPALGCYTTGKKTAHHYIMQGELKEELFISGVAFQKNGRYDKAVEVYARLLEEYPNESNAHYNLGMIYAYKIVNKSLALKHFDNFLSFDGENPKAANVAEIMCVLERSSPTRKSSADEIFAEWASAKPFKHCQK
jgi:tetratricopeptide (TPR) repeat protein